MSQWQVLNTLGKIWRPTTAPYKGSFVAGNNIFDSNSRHRGFSRSRAQPAHSNNGSDPIADTNLFDYIMDIDYRKDEIEPTQSPPMMMSSNPNSISAGVALNASSSVSAASSSSSSSSSSEDGDMGGNAGVVGNSGFLPEEKTESYMKIQVVGMMVVALVCGVLFTS